MQGPMSHGALPVAPDLTCAASTIPVPGFGALPVNAFLIEGAQPVLVDTGMPALAEDTIAAISTRIDPAELRWIWLTHCDADHTGALEALLAAAPSARVVTNYLGMGKLTMRLPLPPERFYLINPGQTLDVGDRRLRALSLPSYDAPETMGAFDLRSRTLFSSDCFGALLVDGAEPVEDAAMIGAARLAEGLVTWSTVDAPWLAHVKETAFRSSLAELARLAPDLVLSAHLPPARGMLRFLSDQLDVARGARPFVGPDQAALQAMLSGSK